MSITLPDRTAATPAPDARPARRRLAPEQVAAVAANQRAHLSYALSMDAPEGEDLVRRAVALLAPLGWRHLWTVTWPEALPGTVAHLVVGPGGVVVVDERLWTGPLRMDGDLLRHAGFPCDREVAALEAAVVAMSALLPEHLRSAVRGVVAVTPRDVAPFEVGGVHVVGRLHLGAWLAGLEEWLNPPEVIGVVHALASAFGRPVPAAPGRQQQPEPVPATPAPPRFDGVPSQRPSPEADPHAPAAYFLPPQAAAAEPPAHPAVSRRVAQAALRVAVAVLVGFLTYQGSDAIDSALGDWLGGTTATVAIG